jgi:DNA gyrase subunit B
MADADVDGAHISALLLRMFVMYFPQMIEAGMVYKAIPPLYSIKQGKKNKYFTEQIDIVRYIQKLFVQKYTMATVKKQVLENKQITVFFMKNNDYNYHLLRMANTYAVDPYLLEMILINYIMNKDSINVQKLNKDVKSKYRFMGVEKIKNTVIVKGTIDKSNMVIINDKFIFDCRYILDILRSNDNYYYLINGELKSIYEIMSLYDNTSPNGVQRYKGLGEMDKEELAESTLYPGSDRTLVRYTLKDAKEQLEAVREYESDSKKILNLVGNISRDDLLD